MVLKEKDGVTTVFVILLMVVLLMFGIGVLTITLSNENLSKKKDDWIEAYYSLEKNMAEEMAETTKKLHDLQEDSGSYETFEDLYMQGISETFPVYTLGDHAYIELLVRQDEDKYLMAELRLLMPSSPEDLEDFKTRLPYEVVTYIEQQTLFDYEDIDYENPYLPKGAE